MKKIFYLLVTFTILFTGIGVKAQLISLTTTPPLIANNTQSGVSFNMEASGGVDITIQDIDVTLSTGFQSGSVWYSTTPINGAPTIMAPNWVQISGFSGTGNNTTPVPFANNLNITIPAGQTYGFFIQAGSLRYMTFASGPSTITDGTLTIETGQNVGYGGAPPNPNFFIRQFLGTVHYEISNIIDNDAEITSIDKPGEAICDASQDVEVTLANPGRVPLTSAEIKWYHVPSGGSGGAINTFNWTGNIPPLGALANINIGNLGVPFQPGDSLVVWSEMPNGVPDSLPVGDTVAIDMDFGVAGIFTVGGSLPDFPTVVEAANYIDSIGRICDTVIFDIRPGEYIGRFSIGHIFGSRPDRPIIFRAEQGDATAVIISDSSSNSATNNYIGLMDGADNIWFENLTITNKIETGNFRRVFNVRNESQNVHWVNCILTNKNGGNNSTTTAIIYSDSSSNQLSFILDGCTLTNGSYGLYWEGESFTSLNQNSKIINNNFEGQRVAAARVYNQERFTFNNNTIISLYTTSANNSFGLDAFNLTGGFEMNSNAILSTNNFPNHGIRITGARNFIGRRGNMINNAIAIGDSSLTTDFYGIYIEDASYINKFHNSVAVYGTSTNSTPITIIDGGGNISFNNIFANFGPGVAMDFSRGTGLFPFTNSDNNAYYSEGSALINNGGQMVSLAGWASSNLLDFSSIVTNPLFYGQNDLHVCNELLNNVGRPGLGVAMDFDGQMRSASTPDIGADEFIPHSNYTVSEDIEICKGDSILIDAGLNFNASATWSDGPTNRERWISQAGTYTVSSTGNCGNATDTFTISFPEANFLRQDTSICFGDQIPLSLSGNFESFTWTDGGSANPRLINQSGVYVAQIVNLNTCTVFDTFRLTTSIPVALPNDTSFCIGNNLFLNPQAGFGSYAWSTGQTTNSIYVDTTGIYSVTHTNPIGCVSSDSIEVTVIGEPTALFSWTEVAGTIIFTNLSENGTDQVWNFGNGSSSTDFSPVKVYGPAGNYTVTLTVTGPCGQDFYTAVVTTTVDGNPLGINDLKTGNEIFAYPNPASKELFLEGLLEKDYIIELYDLNGKRIQTKNITSPIEVYNIDVSGLATGSYFLRILSDKKLNTVFFQKVF